MKRRSPLSHASTVACTVLLPLSASACGFIFSHGPPEGHENMTYFSCTESNAGPILDIIWGALNVLGAISVASDPSSYDSPDQTIAVGLAWGAVSAPAAAVGFNKSRRCRDAKQQLAARQAHAPPVQGPIDTAGQAVVEAVGTTVQATLDHLSQKFPALQTKLFDGGRVRQYVNLYLNDEDIRYLDNLATPVKDGDELSIIPAVAGG